MKAKELKKKVEKKPQEKPKRQYTVPKKALLGEIIGQERAVNYQKKSEFYKQPFFRLRTRNIENMEQDAPSIVYAFQDFIFNYEVNDEKERKHREEIWRLILKEEYLGKRWIIYTCKTDKGYKLYDLKEVITQQIIK